MENEMMTIKHGLNQTEIQYPIELLMLKQICKERFNIKQENNQILTLSYKENLIKLVEIKTQQDLEQAIKFFKDNKKKIDLQIVITNKTLDKGIPIIASVKNFPTSSIAKKVINVLDRPYSKPQTEKINIDRTKYNIQPSIPVKNFQEYEEISSFNDLKQLPYIYNNKSIRLEKQEKRFKKYINFTIESNANVASISKCKEENNEKLIVFKVILEKIKCVCGDILKASFWYCASCKMWYRCILCGVKTGKTHNIVKFVINENIKLVKLKKNIMKLGFSDEKQVVAAIIQAKFDYSAAVSLLFY